MKLQILVSLSCFALLVNCATVPLSEDESQSLIRQKRSPLILTALKAAGLLGAGVVGIGIAGLAKAGLVGAGIGAGLGAKAGFAAGALTGGTVRYAGTYGYSANTQPLNNYGYRAQARLNIQG